MRDGTWMRPSFLVAHTWRLRCSPCTETRTPTECAGDGRGQRPQALVHTLSQQREVSSSVVRSDRGGTRQRWREPVPGLWEAAWAKVSRVWTHAGEDESGRTWILHLRRGATAGRRRLLLPHRNARGPWTVERENSRCLPSPQRGPCSSRASRPARRSQTQQLHRPGARPAHPRRSPRKPRRRRRPPARVVHRPTSRRPPPHRPRTSPSPRCPPRPERARTRAARRSSSTGSRHTTTPLIREKGSCSARNLPPTVNFA